ncbi:MAG: patatin-like phospholipase family protein [Anaerolineales bacterium]|nr:patatin-like phospholipase family protein [Anaerolineales bacterium]
MQYDLVFEGGGAKGMVFVGAMQAFEAQGHTVGRLLGTSAGAITATLLAAGYTSAEMLAALGEKDAGHSVFASFMGLPAAVDKAALAKSATREMLRGINFSFIPDLVETQFDDWLTRWLAEQPRLRHVFSFIEQGGWYSADNFLTWMRRRLDTGQLNDAPRALSALTLAQYHAVTGKDLTLIASDTTGQAMLILNHQTAPDLPVVWAVRMSMSIPLLWQEVVWQPEWGAYRGKPMSGHVIVDGGLLSNFPLELLVSGNVRATTLMGEKTSTEALGLLIDEARPVPGAPSTSVAGFNVGELAVVKRLNNLVNTTLSARDKSVIEAFEKFVVRLPAQGYGTTEFEMTDERRDRLVAAGREVMAEYLAQRADEPVSFDGAPDPELAHAEAAADKLCAKLWDY